MLWGGKCLSKKFKNNLPIFVFVMEHQKLHGKLSEYVILTAQKVSAAFYEKWEI